MKCKVKSESKIWIEHKFHLFLSIFDSNKYEKESNQYKP